MKKILLLLIALLPLVTSLSVYASDDSITLSGTEASVFVWIGTKGFDSASFSAELGPLNGFFENSFIDANREKGTYLHISAPDCAKGSYDVIVKSRACAGTTCIQASKTIRVSVYPRRECMYTYDLGNAFDYFDYNPYYGDGAIVYSSIRKHEYFDPTNYQVRINTPSDCIELTAGSRASIKARVYNEGSATTLNYRLLGNQHELNAITSKEYSNLGRNEAETILIDVNPSNVRDGTYSLTLQASTSNTVIGDSSICVKVKNIRDAELEMPSLLKGNTCEPIFFSATVQNKGSGYDSFEVITPDFVSVNPNVFSLGPSEFADLELMIDTSVLQEGKSSLPITLSEKTEGKTATGIATLEITNCNEKQASQASVSNITNNLFKYTVLIENTGSSDLTNVKIRIEGVPESWKQESDSITIPAGSSQSISLLLTKNSDEKAEPVLIVESNGKIIDTIPMQTIEANASGLSGFFTALNQNSVFIGGLVLVAIIIVLAFYGRKSKTESE
ncbi:MAG: hypothetical protein ABH803_02865 [Candidatus Micrarchaeota archaeon]